MMLTCSAATPLAKGHGGKLHTQVFHTDSAHSASRDTFDGDVSSGITPSLLLAGGPRQVQGPCQAQGPRQVQGPRQQGPGAQRRALNSEKEAGE